MILDLTTWTSQDTSPRLDGKFPFYKKPPVELNERTVELVNNFYNMIINLPLVESE